MRQASTAARKVGELNSTTDQERLFLRNVIVAPVFHGAVADEDAMTGLTSAARGCWPGDTCMRTDTASLWVCLTNNGQDVSDWWQLGGGSALPLTQSYNAEGDVLALNSGLNPVWVPPAGGSFSGAKVTRTTTQAVSHNTDTLVSWSSADYDTGGYWSSGSPTRLTIPTGGTGKYLITFLNSFVANSTGVRYVSIRKNGGNAFDTVFSQYIAALSGSPTIQATSTELALSAGDYLTLLVYQNSGGSLNITDAECKTYMTISRR